jgi:uncharacterized protein DUF4394
MRTRSSELGLLIGLLMAAAVLAGCDDIFSNDDDNNGPPPPSGNVTSGDVFGITSSGRLVTFNRAAPTLSTAVGVTGLQSGETILGIDVRPGGMNPGELYLLGSTGRLYTVNTTTGAATLKSSLSADPTDTTSPFTSLSGTEFGIDFNPVVDRLRIVSDTGQDLRVNVDTGATITDGNLNVGGTVRMNVADAAYTKDFATTCRTSLFYIDVSADKLFTTTDPNAGTLSEVGNLGIDASAVGGFEISTASDGSDTALAAFNVGSGTTLYSINLMTGAAASLGAITPLNSGETIRGITASPPSTSPTNAVGGVVALTESGKIISFQAGTPQKLCTSFAATGMQGGESLLGLDTRPANSKLYALGSSGRLYVLDAGSGALSMSVQLAADPADATDPFSALSGTVYGVDFNPTSDRLRIVSDTGQDLRVNVDTGLVTTDAPLNPAGPTVVAAAYTNAFAGTGTTTLYELDSTGDQLVVQGQPSGNPNNGDLAPVGPLGIDIQTIAGFDIAGTNNSSIAAVNLAGATTSELHNVNLITGASTKVNTIGGGERVRELALTAIPTATLLGLTTDAKLVSFKLATPATFDSSNTISGLQGGESIIGIDFRPANGKLYAATNAGRIYTINPMTGAATIASTLMADAADATAPYTAIMGTNFGVDFNPTSDRMRIVSDGGQSLRINVDTGATTTDGNLNPGTPNVVAAAYGSNFAGTTATKLYDIDLAVSSLQLQNPPNDGVLTPVGALDPALTFVSNGGFDIVGGDDGLSLASLTATGATQSTLYRVNLKTGATTAIGALGPAGSPVVHGLAIQLK